MARNRWTARGTFGSANVVTSLRLASILALPLIYSATGPIFLVGFGLFLLAADGLDGWLARRAYQNSEFGEYFDKETDAFFLLLLCTLAVVHDRLGPWVLFIGLLRYIFVIAVHAFRPLLLKEEKSGRARIIYILTMTALLAVFLPYPRFFKPLATILSMALLWSFAADFLVAFRPPRAG